MILFETGITTADADLSKEDIYPRVSLIVYKDEDKSPNIVVKPDDIDENEEVYTLTKYKSSAFTDEKISFSLDKQNVFKVYINGIYKLSIDASSLPNEEYYPFFRGYETKLFAEIIDPDEVFKSLLKYFGTSNRREYRVALPEVMQHNFLHIKPVQEDVRIISIKTPDSSGLSKELLGVPFDLKNRSCVQYDTISSKIVTIEIEHPFIDDFSLEELIEIELSLRDHKDYGIFKGKKQSINFNPYLFLSYHIEQAKDSYVKALLRINVKDKYESSLYSGVIPIPLNKEGILISESQDSNKVILDTIPQENSVAVIIGSEKIEDYSISGNTVFVDIPEGYKCHVLYKPDYLNKGYFSEVTRNISIDSNTEILLNKDFAEQIDYSVDVEVFNLALSAFNDTPVVKSLVLSTSRE